MDKRKGWIAQLKVGDTVIVSTLGKLEFATVDKITKSGRMTINHRFYMPKGHSNRAPRSHIKQMTPENVIHTHEDFVRREFQANIWQYTRIGLHLSIDAMRKINQIIKEDK